MITQDLLKEYLDYREGKLFWVKAKSNRVKVGNRWGNPHPTGYRCGDFEGKRRKEHRLIWFYHYGYWPKELDHINGVRDDNRLENLREVTRQQNCYNTPSKGKTSKYKGVSWSKSNQKWRASCGTLGKSKYIGTFNTEEEAHQAYVNYVSTYQNDYMRKD